METSKFSTQEQSLRRILKRFRGGLVFKAHRLLYHSTLGSRVITKEEKGDLGFFPHLLPHGNAEEQDEPVLELRCYHARVMEWVDRFKGVFKDADDF